MIDPIKFTRFDLSDTELEEYCLFGIAVAGKPALVTARNLQRFLEVAHSQRLLRQWQPFGVLRRYNLLQLTTLVKGCGFGCYQLKARGFLDAAQSGINLRTCSTEDLEKIVGIGPKTSRLLLLHTRPNTRLACIDTHILKWLRHLGYENIPSSTPQSRKAYGRIEQLFLQIAEQMNENPAALDLRIWNLYRARR